MNLFYVSWETFFENRGVQNLWDFFDKKNVSWETILKKNKDGILSLSQAEKL